MTKFYLSKLQIIVVISFFFLIVGGCSDTATIEKDQQDQHQEAPVAELGGTYKVSLKYIPTTLDPVKISDIYAEAVSIQIFEGLVRFGPFLEVLPCLAESWKVEDKGRIYRFKLKEGVRFHNGDLVTAEDVIFSIKRIIRAESTSVLLPHFMKIVGAKSYRSRSKDVVSGLSVVGPLDFVIELETPHMPFLAALGMYQAAILPSRELEEKGIAFDRYPIGTGPFKLESYDDNCSIRLVRNEAYHGEPANIDEICYRIYQGDSYSKILDDFKNGLLDEIPVYKGARETLAGNSSYQWFNRPSLSLMFYGMNIQHPNLSSPYLREALSIAIDRDRYVQEVWGGEYEAARTILPLGMPGYSPLKRVGNNEIDIAKNLVKKALPEGENIPEIELVSTVKAPIVDKEMQLMVQFWEKIGVKVRIKYITDWNEFDAYLKSDNVQMYRYAWHADMPDPDSFLYALFSSKSPSNFMQFRDEWVDDMLDTARGIVEPVERAIKYQEIESRIMFSNPIIPLMYLNVNRVYQPHVKDINVCALGAHATSLSSMWLEKRAEK